MSNNENPKALVINALTGEEITRPMTSDELAERQAMQLKEAESQAQKEAQEAARESARAKLAALGLTEAEIAAL